jgi:hypothetical protein
MDQRTRSRQVQTQATVALAETQTKLILRRQYIELVDQLSV